MKRKLLGIMICIMMLATILPITAMATTQIRKESESAGLLGRTFIRGFVIFQRISPGGRSMHYFALRVHYTTIPLTGARESGIIRLRPIELPTSMVGYYGSGFVFASFRGSL